MTDIVERLTAEDILTSIISSVWCKTGRHPGELADLMKEAAEEITRLRAENEKLRLELDMQQATILVPSQKDDKRRIERLDAALKEALDEAASLRAENEKLREALKTVCRGVVAERESLDWFIMDGAALRVARDAIRESGDE